MDTQPAAPHAADPAHPADIMGVRALARALKLNPSTVSRQIKKGIIPNRGTDTEPKASLAEARHARGDQLDLAMQRGPDAALDQTQGGADAAAPDGVDDVAPAAAADGIDSVGAPSPGKPSDPTRLKFVTARTASAGWDARIKQQQFEEKAGLLVPRAKVDQDAFDTHRILRDRIHAWPSQIAGDVKKHLGATADERTIAAFLKTRLQATLTDAAREVHPAAVAEAEADALGDDEDVDPSARPLNRPPGSAGGRE